MKIFYTDGSASPNPGPGGWVVLDVTNKDNPHPVALGKEPNTTNIRMEGTAILNAIQLAKDEPLEIHTDSEFWINVLTKWAPAWSANDWHKKSGPIKNLELVQALYTAYQASHVKLVWVKGHAGQTFNELADEWANRARRGETV